MILVLDSATRTPVVAVARPDGELVAQRRWKSHHRHGEELLQRIDEALVDAQLARDQIRALVVGTGPGSFTGLRIGLATAKTIAYSLGVPIVGLSSTLALANAAAAHDPGLTEIVVTLPAGASDFYVHRFKTLAGAAAEMGPPELVAGRDLTHADVAVDIDAGAVTEAARARGTAALEGLAGALALLGMEKLELGPTDDVAELVPAYVALPRGIARAAAEMEWSPDLR